MKEKNLKIIFLVFLAVLAIGERVWFDFGPNLELLTTVSILAGFFLVFGKRAFIRF